MATTQKGILIPPINVKKFTLSLIGDSPLIVHQWAEKSKKMMLAKQQKKANLKKEIRNPEQEFQDSMYRLPDGGHAFPGRAFKATAKNACRNVDGIAMTEMKQAFHVVGELVRLKCSEPIMREDMVTIGKGTSDLRYRAMYEKWEVDLEIIYDADFMSAEQIINLFNKAGFCSGIGEWRPSSPRTSGTFGMFHVKSGGK